jgi:Domain of unknown function (DUF4349)
MHVRTVALFALIALITTSACAAARPASEAAPPPPPSVADSSAARPAAPVAAAPPGPAPRQQGATGAAAQSDAAQQNLPSLDRMIIRTVTMTIAVGNVQDAFHQVEQIVGEQNGYLAGTQMRQDGDRMTATMTLRVPADPTTYQATLERLRGIAERVVDEQSQAQDVTEEYVDLDARLRTLRASEESLLGLLGKAQRVEDILQIQRELTNVRSQIEQIQGRKQALERRADMATITLTIRETGTFARPGWSASGTVAEAWRALGSALRGLAVFAIWLAIFSPIWGGFLLIAWAMIWFIRRMVRRSRRSAGALASPAVPPVAPAA